MLVWAMVFITLQRYEILSKSQLTKIHFSLYLGVYHSAKIRNFKQITTHYYLHYKTTLVFITLQRYEILSKSQLRWLRCASVKGVYHSAKIRNFKQITTKYNYYEKTIEVFITLQRYEILSKSQLFLLRLITILRCLSLCKDTKF